MRLPFSRYARISDGVRAGCVLAAKSDGTMGRARGSEKDKTERDFDEREMRTREIGGAGVRAAS